MDGLFYCKKSYFLLVTAFRLYVKYNKNYPRYANCKLLCFYYMIDTRKVGFYENFYNKRLTY